MPDNIYSPKYVKGLFNRMSSSYERMNYITSFGFSIRWRKYFLNSFKETNNQVEVIDLLTGMGETWKATKKKLPNSNLTALDFSEEMLKHAHQKSKKKYDNKITVLQQDVLASSLPSNHFDFVTCAFGLKTFNTQQLNILAMETKRILKIGGQFTFIEVSKPKNSILQFFYGLYLGQLIPILGRLLLGNPEEYKMLWKYITQFENAESAAKIFANTGLKTEFFSYFYGCATGFCGRKLN
jgi:demethylmenaquinone methyltransferase/2-methoxy-6-polyprenyl-1,4-benzoquinol methylase